MHFLDIQETRILKVALLLAVVLTCLAGCAPQAEEYGKAVKAMGRECVGDMQSELTYGTFGASVTVRCTKLFSGGPK